MTRAEAVRKVIATVSEATRTKDFREISAGPNLVVANGRWRAEASVMDRNGVVDVAGPVRLSAVRREASLA